MMTSTLPEKRIYLENSPLASSTIVLLDQLKNISSLSSSSTSIQKQQQQQNNLLLKSQSPSSPIITNQLPITKPKSIVSNNNNNTNRLDEKIEINFPLDIGRKILKDTVDKDYFWKFGQHDQNHINEKIKETIEGASLSLYKLIKFYGVSICDLRNFRVIIDIDSLKKLKFKGLDLSIDRKLFNTSHLKTLFNLNYRDLIKNKIAFNLFVLVKGKFTYNELYTIGFDFNLCFLQTTEISKGCNEKELIEYKNNMKQCFQEIYTSRPPQLTYTEMVSLKLRDKWLEYLGIKVEDITRYVT